MGFLPIVSHCIEGGFFSERVSPSPPHFNISLCCGEEVHLVFFGSFSQENDSYVAVGLVYPWGKVEFRIF